MQNGRVIMQGKSIQKVKIGYRFSLQQAGLRTDIIILQKQFDMDKQQNTGGSSYKIQISMEKLSSLSSSQLLSTALLKSEHIERNSWLQMVNYVLAILSIIYLSITNSVETSTNVIFSFIRDVDRSLDEVDYVTRAVALFLMGFSLSIIVSTAILVTLAFRKGRNQPQNKAQPIIRKYIAFSLILFETLMTPLCVIVMSVPIILNQYINTLGTALSICNISFVLLINYSFKITHLYSEYLLLIVALTWFTSAKIFPLCMICLNIFLIFKKRGSLMKVYFEQVAAVNLMVYINANFQADTNVFNLFIVLFLIPIIQILSPANYLQFDSTTINQMILQSLHKLSMGNELCRYAERQLIAILHSFQAETAKHEIALTHQESNDLKSLHTSINKSNLASLLRCRLRLNKIIDPSNLTLDIQFSECELYRSHFNIKILTKIQEINRQVQQKGTFQERLRMMKLIHRLQRQFFKQDGVLNSTTVIYVQKCVQSFSLQIKEVISLYILIWKQAVKEAQEDHFMQRLKNLCDAEDRCIDLLESISKFKDTSVESLIFNYIQSHFNISEADRYNPQKKKEESPVHYISTKFILVNNSKIIDLSHNLCDQIQTNQSALIDASIYSIIPQEFHQYYRKNINNWIHMGSKDSQVILPLISIDHPSIFYPFTCTFKILPNIEGGIKYLIHIQNNIDDRQECYILYSITQDRIILLSRSFYDEYTNFQETNQVQELNFTSEELLGVDLTYLSHLDKMQGKSEELLCEINMNRFERKATTKKNINKPRLLSLKLSHIFNFDNDRVCLLTIIPKHEREKLRTFNEYMLRQNTRLANDTSKARRNFDQSTTFCPIKNPLEEILDERLNEKKQFWKRSFFKNAFILFLLIFGLLTATIVNFNKVADRSINGLTGHIIDSVTSLASYQSIYLLFFQYYLYIHTLKYPEHFVLQGSQLDLAQLQSQYRGNLNKIIDNLVLMATDPLLAMAEHPYLLKYSNYQLQGTTNPFTLLPLLQGIKASLVTNKFDFVIKNSNIVDLYMESLVSIDPNIIQPILTNQFYTLIISFTLILFVVVLVKIQYVRIRSIIRDIFTLYDNLTHQQIDEHQNALTEFQIILSKDWSDNRKVIPPKAKPNADNTKKNTRTKPVFMKQTLLVTLLSNNIIIVAILIISCLFYIYCYTRLDVYREQVQSVLKYIANIQLVTKMNTFTSQRFYLGAVQEILPVNARTIFPKMSQVNIPSLAAFELPPEFNSYMAKEIELVHADICASSDIMARVNKDRLLASMACTDVMYNALSSGFAKSLPYSIVSVNEIIGSPLSKINYKFAENSVYPFFTEVIYMREALHCIIKDLNAAFVEGIDFFLTYERGELQDILTFSVLSLLAICILMSVYLYDILRLSKIGRKGLSLLPSKLIYNIKISKMIINSGMIDQIDLLSP